MGIQSGRRASLFEADRRHRDLEIAEIDRVLGNPMAMTAQQHDCSSGVEPDSGRQSYLRDRLTQLIAERDNEEADFARRDREHAAQEVLKLQAEKLRLEIASLKRNR